MEIFGTDDRTAKGDDARKQSPARHGIETIAHLA
jgi:hypothetical protein